MSDTVYSLSVDAFGVVTGAFSSNVVPPGAIEVPIGVYAQAALRVGFCKWDGAALSDYTPPNAQPLPPPDISDRQFARGLWGDKIITYEDFLGFIGPGTIPEPIQTIVNQLPDDDTGKPTARKEAVGFLTGSKLYSFDHPLVEFFRQSLVTQDPKWTLDYLRGQWILWGSL